MPPRRGQLICQGLTCSTSLFQVMPPRRGQRFDGGRVNSSELFQVMPPRRGQPTCVIDISAKCSLFQVMPPRGGQHYARLIKGGDFFVSSHAPARGATDMMDLFIQGIRVSSHAPARGATFMHPQLIFPPHRFQVMPPRGGQLLWRAGCSRDAVRFKSCPREGGNRGYNINVEVSDGVSSHAPARGATTGSSQFVQCQRRFKSCPREGGN